MSAETLAIDVHDVGVGLSIGQRTSFKSAVRSFLSEGARKNFWPLRHVEFSVSDGEVFGIVGRNGAGKSTLMRILAGTLRPDEGFVRFRGRPTPLLSLDFGANLELSGIENVHLMGLYLGLSPTRIAEILPTCLEFAELGLFAHEPLKHYSSGMVGRLGMALALSIEPDILLIDEVLGAGDEGFREKCAEAMRALMARARAIVIVSHKLDFIERLCHRVAWLDEGMLRELGDASTVVGNYRDHVRATRRRCVRTDISVEAQKC